MESGKALENIWKRREDIWAEPVPRGSAAYLPGICKMEAKTKNPRF